MYICILFLICLLYLSVFLSKEKIFYWFLFLFYRRYCFDDAQEHIYNLMKSDSYARFIKSDQYNSAKSASTASKRQSDNSTSLNNQIFNTKQNARLSSTQESGRYLALVNDPQCE